MGPNEIMLLRAISLLDIEETIQINTRKHTYSKYTCTCIRRVYYRVEKTTATVGENIAFNVYITWTVF